MSTTYYRRFRMELDLVERPPAEPCLPEGYRWVPWHPAHVDRHAGVKFDSFREQLDARVFPCLGDYRGCRRLMADIARHDGFLADATWLLAYAPDDDDGLAFDCGTIQGIEQALRWGAVQNVGIVPEQRGQGLGKALVLQSMRGFVRAGVRRVYLEVTAENVPAVELYRAVGFKVVRTMFKAVEEAPAALLPGARA